MNGPEIISIKTNINLFKYKKKYCTVKYVTNTYKIVAGNDIDNLISSARSNKIIFKFCNLGSSICATSFIVLIISVLNAITVYIIMCITTKVDSAFTHAIIISLYLALSSADEV